ncbi:MAG: hypothetical protein CMP12_02430 [Zunongwangia sp.]|nr:hypothetical protein [Zunongwangia sp.]|tara:strand:+ start:162 stop:467 length:306 start_codon:yes stop_codon:yes gene_type:complete
MIAAKSTKCYIVEYEAKPGRHIAWLREKVTGRTVNLGFTTVEERQEFLRFLAAAATNRVVMPNVFSKEDDSDCVLVSGDLDFDAPDEIRFIYDDNLSYQFA